MSSRLMACLRPRSLLNASVLTLGVLMNHIFPFPKRSRESALAQTSGKPMTQVARELGISDTCIPQWRKQLAENGKEAFPGSRRSEAPDGPGGGKSSPQAGVGANAAGTRHPKKDSGYLHTRPVLRYQFLEEHPEEYPVSVLCEALEVSMRGDYEWRKHPISQIAQSDAELAEQIPAAYAYVANRQVYGSPRLHVELAEQGIRCSRKRLARLRRERGLAARRARHRTPTTHQRV